MSGVSRQWAGISLMPGSDWLAARVYANYTDASSLTVNNPRGCSNVTPSTTQSTARALEYKLREVVVHFIT